MTLCVGASNLMWLPVMGAFSDRIGRRPLLVACTLLMIVTAYPAMLWLVDGPTFWKLLSVELWLSFLYGSYNGAMVVFLTEIMPVDVRTAGFSFSCTVWRPPSSAGSRAAICTYLIQLTGNRAVPGLWLSFAAVCGLVAALVARAQPVEAPQSLRESSRSAAESISLPQM